jgi:hypothetical protein
MRTGLKPRAFTTRRRGGAGLVQLREEIRLLAAGRKGTGSTHTNLRHAASQDYADVTTEDAVSARLVLPQSNGRRQWL